MTQTFASERAFSGTTISAAIAILVFLLKSILDLKPDAGQGDDVIRRTARAIAVIGLSTCATLMIVLTYAVWEWHIWILRIGSYLRVFVEEGSAFPSTPLNGAAGWLSRSRDAGCVLASPTQHWLYSRAASDALIVAMAAVWFVAFAGAGLSFVATRPSLEGAKSPVTRWVWLVMLVTLAVLIYFGGDAFLSVDRLPLRMGIVAAGASVAIGMYRLERLDAEYYWKKHPVRSVLLYCVAIASCAGVFHVSRELGTVKDTMPEMEAEWRCLKATENGDTGAREVWCAESAVRPRRSYLNQNCQPTFPNYSAR
jgi:hypothetical protein